MTPRLQSLGFAKFHLDHDAAAAWAGALECQPGVIVIAGTGSIAFGVNPRGERAIAGGWGWLLGDEGSGYSIGLSALRSVCGTADGRVPPSLLATAVLQHLGLSSADALVDYVYQQPGLSREQIAALTQVVLRCAEQGDVAAKRIFRRAGCQLAMAARAVMERLNIKGHCFISYTGGVWEAQAFMRPGFERVLRGKSRKAQIVPPRHPPAVGAAMLARSMLCPRMGNE
jgi:N-acetylglucosamine kinase-like BadF-type ATPase